MILTIIGTIAILIGLAIRYTISRKRFYRRSPYGTQGFKSYEHSVFVSVTEKIFGLIASLLIIGGIAFIALEWIGNRQTAKIQREMSKPQQEVVKP